MKDKIEEKLKNYIDMLLEKDVKKMTAQDYAVLKEELNVIRTIEFKEKSNKEFLDLIASILE